MVIFVGWGRRQLGHYVRRHHLRHCLHLVPFLFPLPLPLYRFL